VRLPICDGRPVGEFQASAIESGISSPGRREKARQCAIVCQIVMSLTPVAVRQQPQPRERSTNVWRTESARKCRMRSKDELEPGGRRPAARISTFTPARNKHRKSLTHLCANALGISGLKIQAAPDACVIVNDGDLRLRRLPHTGANRLYSLARLGSLAIPVSGLPFGA